MLRNWICGVSSESALAVTKDLKIAFEVFSTMRVSFNSNLSSESKVMLSRWRDTTFRAKLQEAGVLGIAGTQARLFDPAMTL